MIEHRALQYGSSPIKCEQYNHNFLTLDGAPVGPDFVLTFPYRIRSPSAPDIATIRGHQIRFIRTLATHDVVSFPIAGFGDEARDYDIDIENRKIGAGLRITGSRPLTRLALWSIRSVLSVEPFIDVSIAPGGALWPGLITIPSMSSIRSRPSIVLNARIKVRLRAITNRPFHRKRLSCAPHSLSTSRAGVVLDFAYPRPQLRRSQWTSLNGVWRFRYDDEREFSLPSDITEWPMQIVVPFPPESNASGIGDRGFHRACWYERDFDLSLAEGNA